MTSELRRMMEMRRDGTPAPFYGVFLQVAHRKRTPSSPDPAFRILRAIAHEASYDKARAYLRAKIPNGNLLFQRFGSRTLISVSADMTHEEVEARATYLDDDAMATAKKQDTDFHMMIELRKAGKFDELRRVEEENAAEYNGRGWVKYMKEYHGVHADEVLPPGASGTDLEPAAEAAPADAELAEFDDTNTSTTGATNSNADGGVLPPGVVVDTQRLAAVSMIMSRDDAMEAVVYVHELFADETKLEDRARRVGAVASPLEVDVVTVGEWIRPTHLLWSMKPAESSWAHKDVAKLQNKRKVQHEESETKKRELHERAIEWDVLARRMTERCNGFLDREQVLVLMEKTASAEALAAAVGISDTANKERDLLAAWAKWGKK
jgi:hypothetical protein